MRVNLLYPLSCFFIQSSLSYVLPRGGDDAGGHPWIDHNMIVPISQNASPGIAGQAELRFNPLLYVSGGCDPYPAVDASGNLGAGLKPTGGGRSGCDAGGTAQVYVRRGRSLGRAGIMYSYYVPKVRWGKGDNEGHRHYWFSVVVWVHKFGCSDDVTSYSPLGVSFTTDHLTWNTAPAGRISYASSGVGIDQPTHPKMQIHDAAMSPFSGADGDELFERTVVSWSSLPDAAKQALRDVRYEKTQVPVTDTNFQAHMDAAYRESFFGGITDEQNCPGSTEHAPNSLKHEVKEKPIVPSHDSNKRLPKPVASS